MALRLVQLKLPVAEYDSITEIIADQKFVTTWPDHRVSGQLILQLVAPAEACEAIMDKFEQRFQGNPEYHILLLPVEAALPRLPEEEDTDKTPQEDAINEESEKKHRVSREELYSDVIWAGENCLFSARFFKPIFVPPHVDCNLRFWILDFGFKEFCPL